MESLRVEGGEPEGSGEWSVVMTGYKGDWVRAAMSTDFDGVDERLFGKRGLDIVGLCFNLDKHLPAELAGGLSFDSAKSAAAVFEEAGADIDVVRTAEIGDVRLRASEVWSTRCTDHFCFTEIEGLILILGAVNSRDNLRHLHQGWRDAKAWELERAINHFHPGIGPDKQAVERELGAIGRLQGSLRQAYPQIAFTISRVPDSEVSFWQTTSDSPKEPESEDEELTFIEPDHSVGE